MKTSIWGNTGSSSPRGWSLQLHGNFPHLEELGTRMPPLAKELLLRESKTPEPGGGGREPGAAGLRGTAAGGGSVRGPETKRPRRRSQRGSMKWPNTPVEGGKQLAKPTAEPAPPSPLPCLQGARGVAGRRRESSATKAAQLFPAPRASPPRPPGCRDPGAPGRAGSPCPRARPHGGRGGGDAAGERTGSPNRASPQLVRREPETYACRQTGWRWCRGRCSGVPVILS